MYRSNNYEGMDPNTEYYASRQDALNKYAYLTPNQYDTPYTAMQDAILYNAGNSVPPHSHPRGVNEQNCPLCRQALYGVDGQNQGRQAYMDDNELARQAFINAAQLNGRQSLIDAVEAEMGQRHFEVDNLGYRAALNEFGNVDYPQYHIRNKRDTKEPKSPKEKGSKTQNSGTAATKLKSKLAERKIAKDTQGGSKRKTRDSSNGDQMLTSPLLRDMRANPLLGSGRVVGNVIIVSFYLISNIVVIRIDNEDKNGMINRTGGGGNDEI